MSASSPGGPTASEKVGLDALVKVFGETIPERHVRQPCGRRWRGHQRQGEAGRDLQANNPPDSFQGHAGAELTDYIDEGQIEPVNDVIESLGGRRSSRRTCSTG